MPVSRCFKPAEACDVFQTTPRCAGGLLGIDGADVAGVCEADHTVRGSEGVEIVWFEKGERRDDVMKGQ